MQINGEKVAHTRLTRIGYQRNAALDSWRRLIFAELPSPSYCFDSISYFPIIDGNTEYVLLSMLNSQLYEWRFRLTSTNNHVSTNEIAGLPAIRFSFTTTAPERARLGSELQQLYAEGKHVEILAQVVTCLPKDAAGNFIADQEKSDVVHDLLAFLAERMLEMNKEKQQETKGFLSWLEGEAGTRIDDLSPKTKIQNYYDYDFDDFYAVLKKNKNRLMINPSSREKSELLKDEFQRSVDKLGPLRDKIEQTDRLIDKVVYGLYGLTEEEIKIVEGVHYK